MENLSICSMNAYMNKNGVKLLAAVMVMAMVVAGAAVVFSDDGVDAAPKDTQNYSGIVSGPKVQTLENNVIINDDLTITKNGVLVVAGNLTINDGVEVLIEKGGQLIVQGELITINGDVVVTGNGENSLNASGASLSPLDDGKSTSSVFMIKTTGSTTELSTFKDAGVVINGNVTFEKGGYFKGTTNSSNISQILVKNSGVLTVDGDETTVDNMMVYVAVGGEFNLAGTIGTGGMTVSAYGTGNYFTLATANLTLAEARAEADEVSDLTFTVTSKNISAYLEADPEEAVLVKEYALNIDGSVSNLDVLTLDGDVWYTNTADNNKLVPYTGNEFYTSTEAAEHAADVTEDGTTYYATAYDDLVMGKIIVNTLTVKSTAGLIVGDGTSNVFVTIAGNLTVQETTTADYSEATSADDGEGDDKSLKENLVEIKKGAVIEVVGTVTFTYDNVKAQTAVADMGTVAVNGGTITINDYNTKSVKASFYGAYYVDADEVAHVSDLATAIAGAQAASADEVYVYAATDSEKDKNGYGGYLLTSDLTIPADIELIIGNALIVDEGVTMTLDADAKVELQDQWDGKLFVLGTVVDYSGELEDWEDGDVNMYFQVKLVNEETEVNTYTTLEVALATATSGTIYLYNDVVIEGIITIPANVTVQFADSITGKSITFENENATLVINGTLYLKDTEELDPVIAESDPVAYGTVTVNNIIAVISTETVDDTVYPSIYGVYYTADLYDDENDDVEKVITSASVAGTVSADVNGTMTVYGKVSMGTVTFTTGEDNTLTVAIKNNYDGTTNKNVATGDVTLVGGTSFDTKDGAFTGSVKSDVTAGTTTIELNKAMGVRIGFDTVETVDGTTTDMILDQAGENAVIGSVKIATGEVTIDNQMSFGSPADATSVSNPNVGVLSVAQGATLNVEAVIYLGAFGTEGGLKEADTLADLIADNMTFEVAGTVNVDNGGSLNWGYSVITGTVNVLKGGSIVLTLVQNDGTIAIADDATAASVELMVLYGAIDGNIEISDEAGFANGGVVLVMPGADMSAGTIMWDTVNNETNAAVSEVYINGELYATVYAYDADTATIKSLVEYADVQGVYKNTGVKYFTDATLDNELTSSKLDSAMIGTYPAYYITMEAMNATGTISQGTGLTLYIDDVALSSFGQGQQGKYPLTVGTHTVSIDVKAGYDGTNAVITFNGQTVENGGTIDITVDMVKDGFTLVANGAVPATSTSGGSTSSGSDDGMGLTDYLLIILVVLIVIMAIMVAMRLMRS